MTKEICAELGVGSRTIQMHNAHLMDKFGAHSRTGIVLRTLLIGAHVDGA